MISNEDYKFLGAIAYAEGPTVEGVPCRLFLPKSVRDRPRLILLLDNKLWNRIAGSTADCSIAGEMPNGTRIEATGGYIGGGEQRIWFDERLTEGYATARPSEIRVIKPVPAEQVDPVGVFHLTESFWLSPVDIKSFKQDGSVTVERGESLKFALSPEVSVSFENSYSLVESTKSKTVVQKSLVARADLSSLSVKETPDSILPLLDNFLLIVALAESRRCACMSASWIHNGQSTTLYRLNRALPEEKEDHGYNEVFVTSQVEEFLRIGFETLQTDGERELIYAALASFTFDDQTTVTTRFLRYFSVFETLVLKYRRDNDLEFVLDSDKDRKLLKKDLRRFLREHELLADEPSLRKKFYENILGIDRVSLRQAAEEMFEANDIKVDDLWPVFDTSGGWSLTTIRNRLVHGEHFNETEELLHLARAEDCLKALVGRVLLRTLGWDYGKSRSTWSSRRSQLWPASREALTNR